MNNDLRAGNLAARRALTEEVWLEKSRIVQKRVMASVPFQDAAVIFSYVGFNREVKTEVIIAEALARGKTVCIPFTDWKGGFLTPVKISSFDEITTGSGRVPQPADREPFPLEKVNVLLIPGVVFDLHGNRIGMGKGFFDRFLAALPPSAVKIGLAFDLQIVESLTPAPWDVAMDWVMTESRVIQANKPELSK